MTPNKPEVCGLCGGEIRKTDIHGEVYSRCFGECLFARNAWYFPPGSDFHRIQSALALLKRVESGESVEVRKSVIEEAINWMEWEGCDCGVDEKGTCALCQLKAAWNGRGEG